MLAPDDALDSVEGITAKFHELTGIKPCKWQALACLEQLRGKDVICVSGTGSGKTLPIIMPLLLQPEAQPQT
jgi:superfamily II DNA/RNA helicase